MAFLAQVLSLFWTCMRGGFRVGHLARVLSVPVAESQRAGFETRFYQRAEELGFVRGTDGQMVQAGPKMGTLRRTRAMETLTHANTPKTLRLEFGDGLARVALRYESIIVADTGETAFRDGVLDYVSGASNRFDVVPTASQLAYTSVMCGLLALGWAVYAITSSDASKFDVVYTLIVVGGGAGVFSLLAIEKSDGQIRGRGIAILALVLAGVATGVTLLSAYAAI